MARIFLLTIAVAALAAEGVNRTVTVTGATGRLGSKIYLLLKNAGVDVRGVVRNTTKARDLLGCSTCDESEGIFVGDVTQPESLGPAMAGADGLVIATGAPEGSLSRSSAEEMLFLGVANQVDAFLSSEGPQPKDRHVGLMSMQYTTLPDTLFNKILAHFWGGFDVSFFSLQGEAHLMSANVPFTILKGCGLTEDPGTQSHIVVGHDDRGFRPFIDGHIVSRNDIARVLATAAANPEMSEGLRFDICSQKGTPQEDAMEILKDAMFSYDPRKIQSAGVVV